MTCVCYICVSIKVFRHLLVDGCGDVVGMLVGWSGGGSEQCEMLWMAIIWANLTLCKLILKIHEHSKIISKITIVNFFRVKDLKTFYVLCINVIWLKNTNHIIILIFFRVNFLRVKDFQQYNILCVNVIFNSKTLVNL